MDFFEAGNGSLDEIIMKLPKSNESYTLIRDDDAAEAGAPAYWYTECLDLDAVKREYENDGGTASWLTIIRRSIIK